jgi:WD40 repeat protein
MHAALSGDGQRIAILWTDGSVSLYDATGTELPNVGVAKNGPFGFRLALNRDGSRLAGIGGNAGRVIEVGAIGARSTALEMAQGMEFFSGASLSPDGKLLAAPIEPQGGKVESGVWIWDASSGKVRWRLPVPGRVGGNVFSPDNKLLVTTASSNPELIIWDVTTGKPLHRCRTYDSAGYAAFSPDGKTLAVTTGSAAITLWDVASGRMLPVSAEPAAHVVGLRFIFDGKQILGSAAAVHVWGTATGLEERRFPLLPHFWLPAVQISPDMTVLATAEGQTIQLWGARSGRALKAITAPRGPIWRLMFSIDGRRLFTCAWDDPVIRVWDVATGAQVQELIGHSTTILQMAISPDGRWLAAGSIRRGMAGREPIRLWDLASAREARQFPRPQGIAVALEFSPDSKLLCASLVGEEEHNTVIWDPTTGKTWRTLAGLAREPCSLAFSPDGRVLASGDSRGKLELWELATAKRRHELRGHQSMIYSLAFSPDGRLLAASSPDAPVFVWDTARTPDTVRALSTEDLNRAWADLAGEDPEAAYRAILMLAAAPGKAEAFLKERARPLTAPDAGRLGELIRNLDSDSFTERDQAASALAKLGRMAEPALRRALGAKPTAEAGRQMERLLEQLEAPVSDADMRRALRAIEALERLGTPAAKQVLEDLATGAREAAQTQEARAALERLSKRANPGH